jgi:hypothetical protein
MIDSFRFAIAFGPVAIYFFVLAALNRSPHPRVVTGPQDGLALALALFGLVVVGPMELFFPVAASMLWGGYVWLMLGLLYALVVLFLLITLSPRLIIYNVTYQRLRPLLAELAPSLDAEARWAGNSLSLPGLGVQFYIDEVPRMSNVSLIATGGGQDPQGWHRLSEALQERLGEVEAPRRKTWVHLTIIAVVLSLVVFGAVLWHPESAIRHMWEMFNI